MFHNDIERGIPGISKYLNTIFTIQKDIHKESENLEKRLKTRRTQIRYDSAMWHN